MGRLGRRALRILKPAARAAPTGPLKATLMPTAFRDCRLSPGHGLLLPGIDGGRLAAVRAGDPVGPGRSKDRDEEHREFGGAFLEVVVNELSAVLAGCRPSGEIVQGGLDAEEEKHG